MIPDEETEIAALRGQVRALRGALASKKHQLQKAYASRARIHGRLVSVTRRLGKYETVPPPEPLPTLPDVFF